MMLLHTGLPANLRLAETADELYRFTLLAEQEILATIR